MWWEGRGGQDEGRRVCPHFPTALMASRKSRHAKKQAERLQPPSPRTMRGPGWAGGEAGRTIASTQQASRELSATLT